MYSIIFLKLEMLNYVLESGSYVVEICWSFKPTFNILFVCRLVLLRNKTSAETSLTGTITGWIDLIGWLVGLILLVGWFDKDCWIHLIGWLVWLGLMGWFHWLVGATIECSSSRRPRCLLRFVYFFPVSTATTSIAWVIGRSRRDFSKVNNNPVCSSWMGLAAISTIMSLSVFLNVCLCACMT